MGVHMLEVMLRLDKDKGLLNVDIQNMFNTLCRVALMEDIMDSKELLVCDFTSLAAYLNMTYGDDTALWFKLDATDDTGATELAERSCTVPGTYEAVKRKAQWARIASELGVHQGRPLSCFFAAVGLVRCLDAAQRAIDTFNGVDRKRFDAEATDEEKAAAWELDEAFHGQRRRDPLGDDGGEWHGACGGGGEEQSDGLRASDEAEPGGGGAGAATGG